MKDPKRKALEGSKTPDNDGEKEPRSKSLKISHHANAEEAEVVSIDKELVLSMRKDNTVPQDKEKRGNDVGQQSARGSTVYHETRVANDSIGPKDVPIAQQHNDNRGLAHILETLGRPIDTILFQLKEHSITNVDELQAKRGDLGLGKLTGIKGVIQKELYKFCEWIDAFNKKHPAECWQLHFTEDSLEMVETTNDALRSPSNDPKDPKMLLILATSFLHEQDRSWMEGFSEGDFESMYTFAADQVVAALPAQLRNECHFPLHEYAKNGLWPL